MWNDQREVKRYYDFNHILHFDRYYAGEITQYEANNCGENLKKELAIKGIVNALIMRNDILFEKNRAGRAAIEDKLIDHSLIELSTMPNIYVNSFLQDSFSDPVVLRHYTSLVKFEIWMKKKNAVDEPKRKVSS